MLMKSLLKYPVLIIGVLLFALFIFDEHTKKWWDLYTGRFKPNPCLDALTRAEKLGPKYWSLNCNEQVLEVESTFDIAEIKKEDQKRASYRKLANEISELAKVSNPETIELLKKVTYKLKLEDKAIVAITTGEAIAKLQMLKDAKAIAFHIHTSVNVKEITE